MDGVTWDGVAWDRGRTGGRREKEGGNGATGASLVSDFLGRSMEGLWKVYIVSVGVGVSVIVSVGVSVRVRVGIGVSVSVNG